MDLTVLLHYYFDLIRSIFSANLSIKLLINLQNAFSDLIMDRDQDRKLIKTTGVEMS